MTASFAPGGYVRALFSRWRELRSPSAFVVAGALLEALIGVASPWIAARAIDTALPNAARGTLLVLSLLVVTATAYTAWAGWLHERVSIALAHRLEATALRDLFERSLTAPYARLQRAGFGETNEAFGAASAVAATLVASLVESVTLGASTLVIFAALAWYDAPLAIAASGAAAVFALASARFVRREARQRERVLAASSESQELLHVLLRALPTLRASGASARFAERWVALVEKGSNEALRQHRLGVERRTIVLAGRQLVSVAATAWLVQRTLDSSLTLGALMTCSMLVAGLVRNASGLAHIAAGILVLEPYVARVDALIASAEPARDSPERARAPTMARASTAAVALEDVWFRYDDGSRWVLQGYTREFRAGAHTVLEAPSGSGKSTVLRLISGLLEPERGHVTLFGEEAARARARVAYLPQQTALVEASLRDNLILLSGASLERILEVADATGLSEMLASLPMGVETLVSSGGGNLSSGQRQLIALTALFARTEPILLLDEAVSQLDRASRDRIRWDILCQHRTVIAVQHA
jgi:ABC-type bacteriocin/lantibiotic exporter with double-glycine peptidase domain